MKSDRGQLIGKTRRKELLGRTLVQKLSHCIIGQLLSAVDRDVHSVFC